jgi:uncharacterized protein (DUF433 family)
MAMPETNDFLDQFEQMAPDRRELLAVRLLEAMAFPIHPLVLLRHRLPEFPSVVSTPGVCGGSPRLIRTRIPVWLLQHLRQTGFSESKILEAYPTLTAGDLVQAWGYVAAHKSEIDGEIAENERY